MGDRGGRLSLVALLACLAGCGRFDPGTAEAVFLTWTGDPATTMRIAWLSPAGTGADEIRFGEEGAASMTTVAGTHRALPGTDHVVRSVRLEGLVPDRRYRFRFDGGRREHWFRTLLDDPAAPIRFIVAGDVYRGALEDGIYRQAARVEADFAILGGDLVYDNGDPRRIARWYRWLDLWSRTMVRADGSLVPIVCAIGNHDVAGQFGGEPEDAPFYYALFVPPGESSFRVLDVTVGLSVVLLDSDHSRRIAGEQARWLDSTLAARAGTRHLLAVYHVPAYPSVRAYDGARCAEIRAAWVPLFERHGVDVCFEHHDHAYKRTHRLRGGRVDPQGVLYLGDGAFGVPPRPVHNPRRSWYLARAEARRHFWVVEIEGPRRSIRAVDYLGRAIETLPGEVFTPGRVRPPGAVPRSRAVP